MDFRARAEKCETENLCFISLKRFEGIDKRDAVLVWNDQAGMPVWILKQYEPKWDYQTELREKECIRQTKNLQDARPILFPDVSNEELSKFMKRTFHVLQA
jgi:hypothetical protein